MIYKEETALQISAFLLDIKAIKLNAREPFTWASGIKSPIYCDNRITLSYPKIRTLIRQSFTKMIAEEFGAIDLIAGVATGAIAQGALVAQDLGLPFAYVRSAKKEHGMGNQIEGLVKDGQSVVVIEDLVSTGKSSLNAVEALRNAGCNVKGMAAIFTYGLPVSVQKFEEKNCRLLTLTDYEHTIQKALEDDYINLSDVDTLKEWRKDPQNWKK